MGLKAAFVAQMDQSVREQETSALNKAFLELIDSREVDEFILSYHEIEYSAATILKELQKQYPHIKVTRTQESRVSADIYIVAYFCNTCSRYKTCDRESHLKSKVETKIPGKPYILLQDCISASAV
jgi:ABC-type sulfate transport system substrate-binding protein